jgi:hypothetical protein
VPNLELITVSVDEAQIIPTSSRVALTPVNFPISVRIAIAYVIEMGAAWRSARYSKTLKRQRGRRFT